MELTISEPKKALNKAYFKQSLKRDDIELFKTNLKKLFQRINESESEEHNKNIVSDFLKDTYYKTNYEINTSGRKDLVIHLGSSSKEPVAVIIEAKKPTAKTDMIGVNKLNAKAFYELIHYYLQERLINKNKDIKNLIITDIYQWFIFDATEFERILCRDVPHGASLQKEYSDWTNGVFPGKKTDWFYQKIAKPYVENEVEQIECTYFTLDKSDFLEKSDLYWIELYKIFSPEHLLKLTFANDSNVLNQDFYNELLHIIGLEEVKQGNKNIITRKKEGQRDEGSIIENAIHSKAIKNIFIDEKTQKRTYDNADTNDVFSVFLELSITWINRVLFLKLLEGQLIKFNGGDRKHAFLNSNLIHDYGILGELFFEVLALPYSQRPKSVQDKFGNLPYLNSSLFEFTPLEIEQFSINELKSRLEIPIYHSTVLKDATGKKLTGNKKTLDYLFEFLDAYNFASEDSAVIQEQNKTIINASVLGLIFEKINGYKDGSFFTPGFITMYICKETIQKAVLQKFNSYNFDKVVNFVKVQTITDLYNQIHKIGINTANKIINSIRVCDPSVGSGHFLVSALNVLIAIKSELGILVDKNGKILRDCLAIVENDELLLTIDNEPFVYNFKNVESQRIQETIFNEKQTLIENCLFGVDINSKSVNICRLRLWIELLKHSYYIIPDNPAASARPAGVLELQTLPNIDINIKCGNSLVSRFGLNGTGFTNGQVQTIQKATKKYKEQVIIYKSTSDKTTRKKAEKEIERIKNEFSSVVNPLDEDFKKLRQKQAELGHAPMLFNKEEKIQWEMKVLRLTKEVAELENAYTAKVKSIYGNAFEWRFEFPEVLDDFGNFVGFDVIIGNPPYGIEFSNVEKEYYRKIFANIHVRTPESFNYFWGLTFNISNKQGFINLIVPSSFLSQIEFEKSRQQMLNNYSLYSIINLGDNVFQDVATPTCIVGYTKNKIKQKIWYNDITAINRNEFSKYISIGGEYIQSESIETNESFSFHYKRHKNILEKCYKYPTLKEIAEEVATGVSTGFDKAYIYKLHEINEKKLEKKLLKKLVVGGEINHYVLKPESTKQLIYITDKIK